MLAKRVIPCLDCDLSVPCGRVVKGTKFRQIRYAGMPWKMARQYYAQGADEICFLDITASAEKRETMVEVVKKTCKGVFVPVTAGGGIRSVREASNLFRAGADKVSINTAAVENPRLIAELSKRFGSQAVVVAIDAKKKSEGSKQWGAFIYGGRKPAGIDTVEWAKKAERLGAGEILLTSMDRDGTKRGFDMELTRRVSGAVGIPVIASGGAGSLESMAAVLTTGKADAVLAASIFHYGKFTVKEVKEFLEKNRIEVRK